jgi:hypothetical protein
VKVLIAQFSAVRSTADFRQPFARAKKLLELRSESTFCSSAV